MDRSWWFCESVLQRYFWMHAIHTNYSSSFVAIAPLCTEKMQDSPIYTGGKEATFGLNLDPLNFSIRIKHGSWWFCESVLQLSFWMHVIHTNYSSYSVDLAPPCNRKMQDSPFTQGKKKPHLNPMLITITSFNKAQILVMLWNCTAATIYPLWHLLRPPCGCKIDPLIFRKE